MPLSICLSVTGYGFVIFYTIGWIFSSIAAVLAIYSIPSIFSYLLSCYLSIYLSAFISVTHIIFYLIFALFFCLLFGIWMQFSLFCVAVTGGGGGILFLY